MLYSQSLTAGCKLVSFALEKYKHSYELHTFVTKWDVFMKKINVTNKKKVQAFKSPKDYNHGFVRKFKNNYTVTHS